MVWSTGVRESFSLYPDSKIGSVNIDLILKSDRCTRDEVLSQWSINLGQARASRRFAARSEHEIIKISGTEQSISVPLPIIDNHAIDLNLGKKNDLISLDDLKIEGPSKDRFRKIIQVVRAVGLAYSVEIPASVLFPRRTEVRVTELGKVVGELRRQSLSRGNVRTIAEYGIRAIAAAQLRNPTEEGKNYCHDVNVFPFAFLWRAMLNLDCRISSDEINRSILKVKNIDQLFDSISLIRQSRLNNDITIMGDEIISGESKNDRLIPWMMWATFGWAVGWKGADERFPRHYAVRGDTIRGVRWAERVLEDGLAKNHDHKDFIKEFDYFEYLSTCAGLPPDLRLV